MNAVEYGLQYITTDVLAVKFIGKWIVVGIGECIHVFDAQTSHFVGKEKAFEEDRVHNIFDGESNNLAVTGGKRINIFNLDKSGDFRVHSEASWAIDDWILFVRWLGSENIALMTSHNVVSLWNFKTKTRMKNIYCQIKSILYSAALYGSSWNDLLAFSGTAFRQILVWVPASLDDDEVDRPVLHTLTGHDGVIYSVTYDSGSQLICSTSDDRSVRLWNVILQDSDSSGHLIQWENAKITLLHTMYGHTARVWRNIIADNNIISVGEDSLLFIWSHDGNFKKGWRTHQNGSVWSVDYSKERNLVVTGGSDGGVCLWPLNNEEPVPVAFAFQDNLFDECCKNMKNKNEHIPRRIVLTSKGNIVAMTASGCLMYCTVLNGTQGEWNIEYQNAELENYCLLEISPCRRYVALASIKGDIFIFNESDSSDGKHLILNIEKKGVNGRIFSLHWLSSKNVLSCGPGGILQMWHFKMDSPHCLENSHEFELPKSKERWLTAVSMNENFLICGDRIGSIHLFRFDGSRNLTLQGPVQSFYKIHGHLGVSRLVLHGNHLYSSGRDGTLRNFLLLENECRLKPLNTDKLPMEWPADLSFSPYGLLILGFKSVDVLVWCHAERRILIKIPCGGGHRSWDWSMNEQQLTFLYVKDKMVHVVTCRLDNVIKPVVQKGFHTKQILCMRQVPFLRNGNDCRFLVSASEDTTIRVASVDDANTFQPLVVLQSHISSVRCIAVCSLKDGVLVFTGGGRAQLKVWKFELKNVQDVPQITCEELLSHMLRDPSNRNRKPWLYTETSNDPEARYMDLSAIITQLTEADQISDLVVLAAACSDGFLRIFCFNVVFKELKLIGKYSFHNRCLLKVFLTKTVSGKYVVFTMATDGKIALWDISACVEDVVQAWSEINEASGAVGGEITDEKLTPFADVRIHQSGINSFDCVELDDDLMLIATGGDDCALVLNTIHLVPSGADNKITAEIVEKWRNEFAHSSQITGLKFTDNLFISTGIDQRITLWSWSYDIDTGSVSVDLKTKYITTVPDIQGLLTWKSSRSVTVCVHGQGLEIINIRLENGR